MLPRKLGDWTKRLKRQTKIRRRFSLRRFSLGGLEQIAGAALLRCIIGILFSELQRALAMRHAMSSVLPLGLASRRAPRDQP